MLCHSTINAVDTGSSLPIVLQPLMLVLFAVHEPTRNKPGISDHQRYHGALATLIGIWEHRLALRVVALWRRNMAITKMRQARRSKPAHKASAVEVSAAVPGDAKPRRRGSGNWTTPAGSKGGPTPAGSKGGPTPAGSKGGPAWVAPAGSKGGPAVGSHRPIAKAMMAGPTYVHCPAAC